MEMVDNEEKSFSFFMSSKRTETIPEAVRPSVAEENERMWKCHFLYWCAYCIVRHMYVTKENNGRAKTVMNLINRLERRPRNSFRLLAYNKTSKIIT